MSENSAIGWCDHTFNAWHGCMKVSTGCENCYALAFSKRTGHDIWGPPSTTQRRFFGEKHWQEPLNWNAAAQAAGERKRVFSASMSDVFEDHPSVWDSRQRLWDLIAETTNLDWLLLTKRPENVMGMVPMDWAHHWPEYVWLGTSVENQQAADERIPHLLSTPAVVHFLSCEPLLGGVDLSRFQPFCRSLSGFRAARGILAGAISWVICGGESGPRHRPMDLDWLASIVEQCQAAGVATFVKQDADLYPGRQGRIPDALFLKQFPETRVLAEVTP